LVGDWRILMWKRTMPHPPIHHQVLQSVKALTQILVLLFHASTQCEMFGRSLAD
jgi:hypothetical protein